MKKVFVFGAKPLRNQPALTALTHKELYVFGTESSHRHSTPTAPKQEARPRESLPPCIPAVLLRTALRGRRPIDANGRSSKRRRSHHDRRVILGGTQVRAKYSRWWFSQHGGRYRTLHKKQKATSVAKGATEITLKTQRMIPAPRRKTRIQEPGLLILGIYLTSHLGWLQVSASF